MANTTNFEQRVNEIEKITVNALQNLVDLEVPDYAHVEGILENVVNLVEFSKNIPYGSKADASIRFRNELESLMNNPEVNQLSMEGHIDYYFERFCFEDDMQARSADVALSSIEEVCEDLAEFNDGELYPAEDFDSRQEYIDAFLGEAFWSFVIALAITTKNHFESIQAPVDAAIQNSILNDAVPTQVAA